MSRSDLPTASLPLLTGAKVPVVGLGVWQSPRGEGTRGAVLEALRIGYRHVDTAATLTHGKRLGDPTVVAVAGQVQRSPAQVLLRWGVQRGFVVLPKSTRAERIAENGALFDFTLDAAAMAKLDGLEEGLVTGWDPADQE